MLNFRRQKLRNNIERITIGMQRAGYVVIVPDPEILQKKRSLLELAKKGP